MPPYQKTGEVYFGDTFERPFTVAFCNNLEDESVMQKGSIFIPQSCDASFTAEIDNINSINYGISGTVDTMQNQLQEIVSRVQALEDALKCQPAQGIRNELRTLNYKRVH
jgi:hypothetical protein